MRALIRQSNASELNSIELDRLGIDYEGKGVLAFKAFLLAQDVHAEPGRYKADIRVYSGGSDEPAEVDRVTVRAPFKNKSVLAACREFGQRTSMQYAPIIFDSVKQLRRVSRIELIWTLPDGTYKIVEHDVSFLEPLQKGIYGLWTYEDDGAAGPDPSLTRSLYDEIAVFEMSDGGLEFVRGSRSGGLDADHVPPFATDAYLNRAIENLNPEGGRATIHYYRTRAVLTDDAAVLVLGF